MLVRPTLLALLFTVVTASSAPAQTLTTVLNNGPSANRVDIVVLGDGYTSAELPKFASDVQQFVLAMFNQQPFKEYLPYFNVHRVDVASAESGADHPEREPSSFKNTAFDAAYNCGGIERLICVNETKVLDFVTQSFLPSQRDIVLLLVNDTTYGGSGSHNVAVSSLDPNGIEIVLHELGHSFGHLADEYGGPPPPSCDSSAEPVEANATKIVTGQLKWGLWIDSQTLIPTPGMLPGVPGLYQGAKYCDTGLFRPTFDSKMRSLNRPFEQINSEQLVKRYYAFVSPIESYTPSSASASVRKGQPLTFAVSTVHPATHSLEDRWSLDGVLKGTGTTYLLDSGFLSLGDYVVQVVSQDKTERVRSDPSPSALQDTVDWVLHVLPSQCDLDGDGRVNVVEVQRVVLQVLGRSPSISDLNLDGRVDVADVMIMVNVALREAGGVYACPIDK